MQGHEPAPGAQQLGEFAFLSILRQFDLSVVVAVAAVRMMKVAIHQIVDMIAMRNCFVTAAGAMHMSSAVAATGGRAAIGILGADFDDVFVDVPAFHMIQMPFVQEINMPFVYHRDTGASTGNIPFVSFGVAHNF